MIVDQDIAVIFDLVCAHAGATGTSGEFATLADGLRAVLDAYSNAYKERHEMCALIERVVHEEGGPDDLPHRAVSDMIEWYRSRR